MSDCLLPNRACAQTSISNATFCSNQSRYHLRLQCTEHSCGRSIGALRQGTTSKSGRKLRYGGFHCSGAQVEQAILAPTMKISALFRSEIGVPRVSNKSSTNRPVLALSLMRYRYTTTTFLQISHKLIFRGLVYVAQRQRDARLACTSFQTAARL